MTATISVVIPTLNDETLPETIEAIIRQTRVPDEILVVGRDEAGITNDFPQVVFLDTGKAVCAAAARNRGIAVSHGDIVAFTDSDCIPDPDWLKHLEHAHDQGAEVVGGGVSLHGSNYWAQSDNVSMFHDFVSDHPEGKRRFLPTLNLSVRRSVIDVVGYMDESFPGAAAEDTDWTIRMSLAGYTLSFKPEAEVRHAPSRTRWEDVVRHWRNCGYSAIRVRQRYLDQVKTPAIIRTIIGSAPLMRWLSPLIAVWVTTGIYANPIFWRHLSYLPVVYVTKIIYCLGAAASIEDGFAFDHPSPAVGMESGSG